MNPMFWVSFRCQMGEVLYFLGDNPRGVICGAHLGKGLGDPGLDVVGGCAEMLTYLGH